MRIPFRLLAQGTVASAAAIGVLCACTATSTDTSVADPADAPARSAAAPGPATTTSSVAEPAPALINWFDLEVGTCLADPPPVDPNVISVTVVDCESPHLAEVYLRTPLAVNTALAEVADRECGAGFLAYTGQPIDGSPFTTTYLIDSNQNRTSSNPNPSTVICLLQSAGGEPLTDSARH